MPGRHSAAAQTVNITLTTCTKGSQTDVSDYGGEWCGSELSDFACQVDGSSSDLVSKQLIVAPGEWLNDGVSLSGLQADLQIHVPCTPPRTSHEAVSTKPRQNLRRKQELPAGVSDGNCSGLSERLTTASENSLAAAKSPPVNQKDSLYIPPFICQPSEKIAFKKGVKCRSCFSTPVMPLSSHKLPAGNVKGQGSMPSVESVEVQKFRGKKIKALLAVNKQAHCTFKLRLPAAFRGLPSDNFKSKFINFCDNNRMSQADRLMYLHHMLEGLAFLWFENIESAKKVTCDSVLN
jgi:hypothetical protein